MLASHAPTSISEYISAFPPPVQAILERIRQTVRAAVPAAQETISYRMPAFRLDGILLYFAAFKSHRSLSMEMRHGASAFSELPRALGVSEGRGARQRQPFPRYARRLRRS